VADAQRQWRAPGQKCNAWCNGLIHMLRLMVQKWHPCSCANAGEFNASCTCVAARRAEATWRRAQRAVHPYTGDWAS